MSKFYFTKLIHWRKLYNFNSPVIMKLLLFGFAFQCIVGLSLSVWEKSQFLNYNPLNYVELCLLNFNISCTKHILNCLARCISYLFQNISSINRWFSMLTFLYTEVKVILERQISQMLKLHFHWFQVDNRLVESDLCFMEHGLFQKIIQKVHIILEINVQVPRNSPVIFLPFVTNTYLCIYSIVLL